MKQRTNTLFFEDKPVFGLDIGRSSLRVMQVDRSSAKSRLIGYGTTNFDPSAIENGVISKPEVIAEAVLNLFSHHLIGDITTNRVAVSLPIARAFTRAINIPRLSAKETDEAVRTEAEQYIPAAIEDLYLDYSRAKGPGETDQIFVVAIPRRIVDSYLTLTRLLGLEAVLLDTSIGACARMFGRDINSDISSLLIDSGTESADITVYKNGLAVSGTVAAGGEKITQLIMQTLGVTYREATIIKSKYGLGASKKQAQIQAGLKPVLNLLLKEIKRTIRYYEERSGAEETIGQVLVMGGSANMPGLAEYLTDNLRLPVRSLDPTTHLDFGHLQPFSENERMSYVTVAGLALTNPHEVFS